MLLVILGGMFLQRFMMFIDSNNFFKNSEKLLEIQNPKFSWHSLILGIRDLYQDISPDSKFVKAYYYTALSDREDNPKKYDAQKKFIEAIRRISFVEVVVGYLMRKPKDNNIEIDKNNPNTYYHTEKNTDVNLSNDILENAFQKNIDIAILVAADGDYEDTVNKARKYGVDFYLVLPMGAPASKMKSIIDRRKIIYLDETFLRKYLFEKK